MDRIKKSHAYETALQLKEEGKIRHFGISFHDRAEVLEQILTEYPQIEVVQIQFNYADFDDPAVQAGKCYEICRKHGKQVIVMEPVRGGSLANLPDDAKAVFEELHGYLCDPLCGGIPGYHDGPFRNEQSGADEGKCEFHEGLQTP